MQRHDGLGNVFGSWMGWSPRDRSIPPRHARRSNAGFFQLWTGEQWTPLVPTLAGSVYAVSLWETHDAPSLDPESTAPTKPQKVNCSRLRCRLMNMCSTPSRGLNCKSNVVPMAKRSSPAGSPLVDWLFCCGADGPVRSGLGDFLGRQAELRRRDDFNPSYPARQTRLVAGGTYSAASDRASRDGLR